MVAVSRAIVATAAASGAFLGVAAASSRPDLIDLPVGFFPEGIALAEEWTVYVGLFNEGGLGGPHNR